MPCRDPRCPDGPEPKCSHSCVNTPGGYYCTCPPGYTLSPDGHTCFEGENPEVCQPPCLNGGSCVEGRCVCQPGLTGRTCATDINECLQRDLCQYQCRNTFGSFACICPAGSNLNADGVTCSSVGCFPECMNGGVCNNSRCICPRGYTGATCFQDVDECSNQNGGCEHICRNILGSYVCFCPLGSTVNPDGHTCSGGQCFPPCQNNGTCVNRRCVCPPGFQGPTCQYDVNECIVTDMSPCSVQCVNTFGSYHCTCPIGYQLGADGRSCTLPCGRECVNGGTCNRGVCECAPGFTGLDCSRDIDECASGLNRCPDACQNTYGSYRCSCPLGFQISTDGTGCIDFDECQAEGLQCAHRCTNLPGSYACTCPIGQRLGPDRFSCIDVPCIPPCVNGGQCVRGACQCPIGFIGEDCSQERPCDDVCRNGGFCYQGACQCGAGFTGEFCQTRVCEPACINGGVCNAGVCQCPSGFSGLFCQERVCDPPCMHDGTCVGGVCICQPGFTGKVCQDLDCIRPCQNGGTCNFGACVCPTGYEGIACELEKHVSKATVFVLHYSGLQCESRECWPLCQNGGVCLDGLCECPYGYLGQYCQIRLAGCEQRPCQNGGTCVNGTCICHASYSGPFCSIVAITPCDPPCFNGGVCLNGVCECEDGSTGQFCQHSASLEAFNIHIYPNPNNDHMVGKTVGFICETNSTSMSDIPQWYDQNDMPIISRTEAPGHRIYYEPIAQNASYLIVNDLSANDRGRYVCAAGLTMRLAMTLVVYVPQCQEPCLNGGTCFNNICMCRSGFEGPRCGIEMDRCPACANGGYCINYKCICQYGFVGTMCQISVGEEYYVRLTIPSDQSPTVGGMVTVICEVVGWSPTAGLPEITWVLPSGQTIFNRQVESIHVMMCVAMEDSATKGRGQCGRFTGVLSDKSEPACINGGCATVGMPMPSGFSGLFCQKEMTLRVKQE
nr:neurogenic locus notch homolog protein 2-like [Lytechinus pictus]